MKKFLISIFILSIGTPVLADIVRPNLTPEQRIQIQKEREERYFQHQKMTLLNRLCGYQPIAIQKNLPDFSEEKLEQCRIKLKKDYEQNLIFLDKYVKDSKEKYNANKNLI